MKQCQILSTALHYACSYLVYGTRNRVLECHACLKQGRSDLLKLDCKTKHGMSDDQIKMLKKYSCQYCKKHFSRSIYCRYHELHCKPKKPDDVTYRHDLVVEQRKMVILKKLSKVLIILL